MSWPPTRPAADAGESGMTSAMRTFHVGSAMKAIKVKMIQARTKFTRTPATRMSNRVMSGWLENARGSSDSTSSARSGSSVASSSASGVPSAGLTSSPSMRTKPPMGSQLSV